MNSSRRIYSGLIAFILCLAAAIVLPKILASSQTGLAAAGTAAMVFLALVAVATGIGLYCFTVALRARKSISIETQLCGFIPLPLLVVVMALSWYFAIYKNNEIHPTIDPKRTVTMPAQPNP